MQVTAQAAAGEVEVSLSGNAERYRPATYDDPAEGGLSDAEVTGLYLQVMQRDDKGQVVRGAISGVARWVSVDILKGLDRRSVEIVLANVQRALGDQEVHDMLENALEREAA